MKSAHFVTLLVSLMGVQRSCGSKTYVPLNSLTIASLLHGGDGSGGKHSSSSKVESGVAGAAAAADLDVLRDYRPWWNTLQEEREKRRKKKKRKKKPPQGEDNYS